MSATNRGSERRKDDFYETPDYTVKSLLDNHTIKYPALECSCGRGAILKHLDRELSDGCDINPDFNPDVTDDYLTQVLVRKYNTVITNPPYVLAQEFVQKALKDVEMDGEVIMLLRLNFLESIKRQSFWKTNPPSHIYVMAKRPSFTGKGTDATGYAWFVWTKGNVSGNVKMGWV